MTMETATGKNGFPRYTQTGNGPPVVLIHGLLGASFCWRFTVPALASERSVYAVDLPGFGQAEAPPGTQYGMQAQAAGLLSWMQAVGLQQVDVVAASWGGAVALFLAGMAPAAVRSMVLAAPVNPWSDLGRGRIRFFSGAVGATLLRMGLPFSRPLHLTALQRMYGDPSRIRPGTIAGYSEIVLRKGRARNLIQTLRSWKDDLEALPAAMERVQSPTLLVWGTRDGAVDLRSAEALRRRLPRCELAIIEGAGHLPFEETPEEFNRLALGFLDRVSGQS